MVDVFQMTDVNHDLRTITCDESWVFTCLGVFIRYIFKCELVVLVFVQMLARLLALLLLFVLLPQGCLRLADLAFVQIRPFLIRE